MSCDIEKKRRKLKAILWYFRQNPKQEEKKRNLRLLGPG
jgi:hypothetical protein